jgi:class 3 adenylate cyclase
MYTGNGDDLRAEAKGDSRSTVAGDRSEGRKWIQSGWDLLVESSDGKISRRIPVCYSHVTIGSKNGHKQNDIYFNEPGMANRQAILKLIEEKLFFNSLSPEFTVQLNNSPCTFAQLESNDVLCFGKYSITVLDLPTSIAFLESYTEPHRKQQWTLKQGRNPIGRSGSRKNHVELEDQTVSRSHATILQAEGHYIVQPDGKWPIWVNGDLVNAMCILSDEDIIQMGNQLMRFRCYKAKSKPRALLPREATILFSDIWNYTTLAESRPLEETIGQLNEIYKKLGRVIIKNQGTLMTYLGDAMMAVFGADQDMNQAVGNHAELAVRAALGMLDALEELNVHWGTVGYPQLQIGIGVATGEVMLGDVGVTGHREFAAMGDTTNVASRVEKLTRQNGVHLLVNGETARQVKDAFILKELGTVEVKGRRKPVDLYQVISKK